MVQATQNLPFFYIIIIGFATMIGIGAILLMLPMSQAPGQPASLLVALFTATSAVTATGLTVVDTASHWSLTGQLVLILLVQAGGLGFMTFSSFVLLVVGRRVNLRDFRVSDALGTSGRGGFLKLALGTLLLTIVCEGIGAVLLRMYFSMGLSSNAAWWQSIFHAVSAFNNAGFDILGGARGFSQFQGNSEMLLLFGSLIFLGGISAPVIFELLRRPWALSLDSKVALVTSLFLLLAGTAGIAFMEYGNPRYQAQGSPAVAEALFTSATARTAGFDLLNVATLTLQSQFLLILLMFVGGVSGSTAGGIKVGTFAVLFLTAFSYIGGKERVTAFGRQLPERQIHKAIAVLFFSFVLIAIAAFVLTITERAGAGGPSFHALVFETISAFSTVGLSTGITPTLSIAGKLVLIAIMFIGRLGPLGVALALTEGRRSVEVQLPEEYVRVG